MKGLEVIGNNIANVNTTSFKASQAKYADSFSNIL
jgi:flagellar hook protein FlgE